LEIAHLLVDSCYREMAIARYETGIVLCDPGRKHANASRQGQVRQVHLDAHLKQTALLTSAQIDKYNRLRGYGMTQQETHQPRQH